MSGFQYTEEEKSHLKEELVNIQLSSFVSDQYDATYFRTEAKLLEENPYVHFGQDYPHPDDVDASSAKSMHEEADKIECGAMTYGEELP